MYMYKNTKLNNSVDRNGSMQSGNGGGGGGESKRNPHAAHQIKGNSLSLSLLSLLIYLIFFVDQIVTLITQQQLRPATFTSLTGH